VYVAESAEFKLKKTDALRLNAPAGGALLDSYAWDNGHLDTYGRIPNGTGDFVKQATPSKGELNPTPTEPGEGAATTPGGSPSSSTRSPRPTMTPPMTRTNS
jgi:hypothetical protein